MANKLSLRDRFYILFTGKLRCQKIDDYGKPTNDPIGKMAVVYYSKEDGFLVFNGKNEIMACVRDVTIYDDFQKNTMGKMDKHRELIVTFTMPAILVIELPVK